MIYEVNLGLVVFHDRPSHLYVILLGNCIVRYFYSSEEIDDLSIILFIEDEDLPTYEVVYVDIFENRIGARQEPFIHIGKDIECSFRYLYYNGKEYLFDYSSSRISDEFLIWLELLDLEAKSSDSALRSPDIDLLPAPNLNYDIIKRLEEEVIKHVNSFDFQTFVDGISVSVHRWSKKCGNPRSDCDDYRGEVSLHIKYGFEMDNYLCEIFPHVTYELVESFDEKNYTDEEKNYTNPKYINKDINKEAKRIEDRLKEEAYKALPNYSREKHITSLLNDQLSELIEQIKKDYTAYFSEKIKTASFEKRFAEIWNFQGIEWLLHEIEKKPNNVQELVMVNNSYFS